MIEEPEYNRKKRRKKGKTKKEWEELREAPITGMSTMADGSLVSAPISGKALPRLGRAIRSSMTSGVITGDQNPLTRVDGNENGLIFDGTWREMPDPTPGNRSGVSGRMGRRDNPTKFVGLDTLLAKHFAQSEMFDEWEKNNDWNAFHRNHFDWWMFPMPRGSNSYGDGYNITGQPLETLKANEKYMQSLAKSVRQYLRAMAWDVDKNDWVDNADVNNGQNPIRNINSARLYKIAQSTYAHGMMEEHRSIRKMANSLIDSGVRVGNEEYWAGPVGVSGRMANGNNINPAIYPVPNGENVDPFSEDWKNMWDSRDDMSSANNDKLWDWKNEEDRIAYAKQIKLKKVKKGFLSWGDGNTAGKTLTGTSLELLPMYLKLFGLIHQRKGTGYPGFSEPYTASIFTHSQTPKGVKADANIVSDMLGQFYEDGNPFQFYTRFENWIRNPFVVIRDPKTGIDVGVRKYFDNNRQLMLTEFRARVKSFFDAAFMKEHGKTWDEFRGSSQDLVEVTPKEILDSLKTSYPDVVEKSKTAIARIIKNNPNARSMHRLHSIFSDELSLRASPEDIRLVTPGVLREMIKESNPSFDDEAISKFPDFFEPDIFADLSDSQIDFARDFSDSMIQGLIEFDGEDVLIPQSSVSAFAETLRGEFLQFTDNHARSIMTDSVLRLNPQNPGSVSGKMSTPDSIEAEYIGYNPDNPESIANHMLSPESSYDVRPKPVKSIQEARDTGAPLEWLMPGNYPPEIEEILNDVTDYIISNGFTSIEDVQEMGTGQRDDPDNFKAMTGEKAGELQAILSRLGFGGGADRELSVEEQSIVEALAGVKVKLFSEVPMDSEDPRAAMLKNLIQLNPNANEMNQIALGLIQRAATAGFKTNFLSTKSGQGSTATEQTLELWQKGIRSAISVNAPEFIDVEPHELPTELAVAMPIQATIQMLESGKFKTLFESGTSRGNSLDTIRRVQEFALFGYLPSFSGQRPVYGFTAPDGITEGGLDATHHYGPIKLVMKPDVNSRSTWTESDSLSLASTASSFSNPSKHALFNQEIKGDLKSFLSKESGYTRFNYTETQIHGGITTGDVAYIVVDDRFYNEGWPGISEWPAIDGNGQAIDDPDWERPDNLEDYGPYIQISRIAQSLNIPIVRASEVAAAGEDEVFRP